MINIDKVVRQPRVRRLMHPLAKHLASVVPNSDYSRLSFEEAKASLEALRWKRSFQFVADRQLFRRRLRPESLKDQLLLLGFLSGHPKLSHTSRHFAYIAACHKSMEALDFALCQELHQQIDERIEVASRFPDHRSNIRKSRTHILFSTIVAQLHLELFLGRETFIDCVKIGSAYWTPNTVRLKKRALFKTSSNVARVLGMSVLVSSIREDWTEADRRVNELHEVFRRALHAAYVNKVAEDIFLQDIQILGVAKRVSGGKSSHHDKILLLHSCLRRENSDKVAIMTDNFIRMAG